MTSFHNSACSFRADLHIIRVRRKRHRNNAILHAVVGLTNIMVKVNPCVTVEFKTSVNRPAEQLALFGLGQTEEFIQFVQIGIAAQYKIAVKMVFCRDNFFFGGFKISVSIHQIKCQFFIREFKLAFATLLLCNSRADFCVGIIAIQFSGFLLVCGIRPVQ